MLIMDSGSYRLAGHVDRYLSSTSHSQCTRLYSTQANSTSHIQWASRPVYAFLCLFNHDDMKGWCLWVEACNCNNDLSFSRSSIENWGPGTETQAGQESKSRKIMRANTGAKRIRSKWRVKIFTWSDRWFTYMWAWHHTLNIYPSAKLLSEWIHTNTVPSICSFGSTRTKICVC